MIPFVRWRAGQKLRCLCRRSFVSALSTNVNTDNVVATFGPIRRDDGMQLLRAEELVKSWRNLFHPTVACGSRSYALIGVLADVENALIEYVCDRLKGIDLFTFMEVSDVLPLSTTKACGFGEPMGDRDGEVTHAIQYLLDSKRNQPPTFCLSGTAEMGIAHNLIGKTFRQDELPKYFMARSRCFRPEISKNAHETGLYRVHEFNKVEMFAVCKKNESEDTLERIVEIQRQIFEGLHIHCRIRDMPAEDLSVAAHRKFDIEAWMPGRQIWGEISSASNCRDFQAKRLDIKYSTSDGVQFAHTCNGTAIATPRALIAMLETHQNTKRKSFEIPDCLKKYMPPKRSPVLRMQNCSGFTYT